MKSLVQFLTEAIDRKFVDAFDSLAEFSDVLTGEADMHDLVSPSIADALSEWFEANVNNTGLTVEKWITGGGWDEGDRIWNDFYRDTKVNRSVPVLVGRSEISVGGPMKAVRYQYIVFDTPEKKKIAKDIANMIWGVTWKKNI